MSAKDKQKLGILIGLVVVVAALFYFLVLRKPKEEAQAPARPTSVAQKAPTPGLGLQGPAAAKPGSPGAPGPFAAALARKAAAQATAVPIEPSRADPFASLIPPPKPVIYHPPPPPPAVYQVGIPLVTVQTLPTETVIAQEQGQRRTAGVLWDHQVWAIIETEKTTAVVQPGDTVEGDTVRAISPQGLVLAIKGGEEVDVPLRGRIGSAPRAPLTAPEGRPGLPGPPPSYEQ